MHEIPSDALNSNIEFCIDEYVRNIRDREMLRDKWFRGLSLEQIAQKYDVSTTTTKKVIYDIGDPILLRASSMTHKSGQILLVAIYKIADIIKQMKEPKKVTTLR